MRDAIFNGLPIGYQLAGLVDAGAIALIVLLLVFHPACVFLEAARDRWRRWRVQTELVRAERARLDARDSAPAAGARVRHVPGAQRGVDARRRAPRDPDVNRDVYTPERRAQLRSWQRRR